MPNKTVPIDVSYQLRSNTHNESPELLTGVGSLQLALRTSNSGFGPQTVVSMLGDDGRVAVDDSFGNIAGRRWI